MEDVFAAVDARPKSRQGVTGQTIEAQMRGTMCQITEYELDMLRDEIARLTAERDEALASVGAVIEKAYGYGAMDIPAAILEINPDATAALNEMLADAWDDGYTSGYHGRGRHTNPYRKDSS